MKRFSIPPREERERHSHTMSAYVSLLCGYLFLYPERYSRIIRLLQKREFQYLKLKVLLLETSVSSVGNFSFIGEKL